MSESTKSNCFVIMPISDSSNYEAGHFGRVYEYLIKPACEKAGVVPIRADEVKNTNFIILDILKRVVTENIVICDLSSRNPNVLYELGIRQAFDLPVVLIKDSCTERIFDIQGLRTMDYDESLRIDSVGKDINNLVNAILETLEKHEHDGSSLIRLLSLPRAELQPEGNISKETSVILTALGDISERLTIIEQRSYSSKKLTKSRSSFRGVELPSGENAELGQKIYDSNSAEELGNLMDVSTNAVSLIDKSGKITRITSDSDLYNRLSTIQF
jgi:hypothetical protein